MTRDSDTPHWCGRFSERTECLEAHGGAVAPFGVYEMVDSEISKHGRLRESVGGSESVGM